MIADAEHLKKVKACLPVLAFSDVIFDEEGNFVDHTTGITPLAKAGISATDAIKKLLDRYCALLMSYQDAEFDEETLGIWYEWTDEDNYIISHKETLIFLT